MALTKYTEQILTEKGYDFILKKVNLLHRPSLERIDPFAPDISEEHKYRVIDECKRNIWYFINRVCRYRHYTGEYKFMELNLANVAQISLFENGVNSFTVTPRQMAHRTTLVSMLLVYDIIFNGGNPVSFAYDPSTSQNMANKINDMIQMLPSYIKRESRFKEDSIRYIVERRKSKIDNVLRGHVGTNTHIEDVEHTQTPLEPILNNKMVTSRFCEDTSLMLESTRSSVKNKYIEELYNGSLYWTPELFELMYKHKRIFQGILAANSQFNMVYVELNEKEICSKEEYEKEYQLLASNTTKSLQNELKLEKRNKRVKGYDLWDK